MKFTIHGRWNDGTEGHLTWEDGKISGHPTFVDFAKSIAEDVESGKLQGIPWVSCTVTKDLISNPDCFLALAHYVIKQEFMKEMLDSDEEQGIITKEEGDIPKGPYNYNDLELRSPEYIQNLMERYERKRREFELNQRRK